MNWKTVVHLIRVDIRSGRLVRGSRLARFWENKLFTYLLYGGALALGTAVGILAGFAYNTISSVDPSLKTLFNEGLLSLFLSLPTLVLIYSLVFTMMQQIQRSGVRFSVQAPYWLPITWEEHTLASVLANLLGFPLISIVFISSAITAVSFFTGQVAYAASTILALIASAFMASAITEAFRILQVRFIGAVYKSSGRATVWVRFIGSLAFFIVFYIIYFTITSGTGAVTFIQSVAQVQSAFWFIPFVWLGMTLYSIMNGLLLQALAFSALSLFLVLGLFYVSVLLNKRFGLYEPPAITITRGVYAPRAGLLGRLGFSSVEAALMRKDFKAFTRRRELMYIFVLPIIVVLVPLMQFLGSSGGPSAPTIPSLYSTALVFILPVAILSVYLGAIMIGEEGAAIWRIYSSPISAKSLVKSKYSFVVLFSALVVTVTGLLGVAVFHPSLRGTLVAFTESFLLMFALAAISLAIGLRAPDFREVPRPRMIRSEWSLVNLVVCLIAAVAILSPFILWFSSTMGFGPGIDLYPAVAVSVVISAVITFVAYRMALRNAKQLLTEAET